jgi:hypothetical protein
MTKAPELLQSRKIWDYANHNAFTDLIRFNDRFFCIFREGSGYVPGTNGKIRVIVSDDGQKWESAVLIEEEGIDLPDPKLAIIPDGRLIINCGGSDYFDGLQKWHTRVMYPEDGFEWTPLRRVKGIPFNNWFFRITWHNDTGYLVPSICGADPKTGRVRREERKLVLFKTNDGKNLTGLSKSA